MNPKSKLYKKRYNERHRDRVLAAGLDYRKRNRDRERQRSLAYYYSHKAERKAYSAAYRKSNRAAHTNYNKQWLASKPGRKSLYDSRRRAHMKSARDVNSDGVVSWENKWRKKKSVICYWCLRRFPPSKCHTDHITPISRGGKHTPENVCIACSHCNQVKHTAEPSTWNATLAQPALIL